MGEYEDGYETSPEDVEAASERQVAELDDLVIGSLGDRRAFLKRVAGFISDEQLNAQLARLERQRRGDTDSSEADTIELFKLVQDNYWLDAAEEAVRLKVIDAERVVRWTTSRQPLTDEHVVTYELFTKHPGNYEVRTRSYVGREPGFDDSTETIANRLTALESTDALFALSHIATIREIDELTDCMQEVRSSHATALRALEQERGR